MFINYKSIKNGDFFVFDWIEGLKEFKEYIKIIITINVGFLTNAKVCCMKI